ncbi:MAG: hypothetical protein ACMG6E_08410 [Candidatus Roizmanbacteria bacterium]
MNKGLIQVEDQSVLVAFSDLTWEVRLSGREGARPVVYVGRCDEELYVVFVDLQSHRGSGSSHGGWLVSVLQALTRLLSNYANLGLLDMVVGGGKGL